MPDRYYAIAALGLAFVYFAINVALDPAKTRLQRVMSVLATVVAVGVVIFGLFVDK